MKQHRNKLTQAVEQIISEAGGIQGTTALSTKIDATGTINVLPKPTYGPLVETCKRYGINRTTAFRLARERVVATFQIGRRRFVEVESLDRLPERLRAEQEGVQ